MNIYQEASEEMWTLDRGLVAGHGEESIKEGMILGCESRSVRLLAHISGRKPRMGDASPYQVSLSPFYSVWTLNTWGSAQCVQGSFPSSKNPLLNTLHAHPEVCHLGDFSPVGWQCILTITIAKRLINGIRIASLKLLKKESIKDQEQKEHGENREHRFNSNNISSYMRCKEAKDFNHKASMLNFLKIHQYPSMWTIS